MAKTIESRRAERKTETTTRKRKAGKTSGHWISKARRLAIYIRDGFQCQYCGCDLRTAKPHELTLDHLQPKSLGGNHDSNNLITACTYCNSARQNNEEWNEYAPGGAIERIKKQIALPINEQLAKAILKGTASDPRVEAVRAE